MKRGITRREFVKGSAGIVTLAATGLSPYGAGVIERVYRIRKEMRQRQ